MNTKDNFENKKICEARIVVDNNEKLTINSKEYKYNYSSKRKINLVHEKVVISNDECVGSTDNSSFCRESLLY